MKRSEINRNIKEALEIFKTHHIELPPWATWGPERWEQTQGACREVRDCQLGWDLTDFGKGEYDRKGLLLFTVRNGRHGDDAYPKPYAEKIMLAKRNQETPIHFHWKKMEDIINRAGGPLAIQLWKADDQEGLSKQGFSVQVDGQRRELEAAATLILHPGESVTLEPYIYHRFWSEGDYCVIGEVSMVNDDVNDNRFLEPLGRFPEIEEDEAALHYLCTEYPEGV